MPAFFCSAQTVNDLNSKINQSNSDIAALEQQIKAYQNQLDTLGSQATSLNGTLKELDLNAKKLAANISVTENKINNTNLQIQGLGSQINDKQDAIASDTNSVASDLKTINEQELNSLPEMLLSENSFSSMWNDLESISELEQQTRNQINSFTKDTSDLESTKKATTTARDALVILKTQLADQKKIVDQNTADKKKLLAQTKDSETNYQKLLSASKQKEIAAEKDISNYESQIKYILNPSTLPNAGVLSWPLDDIFVTQMFGQTVDSKRLYVSGTHNGTDFRASVGTPVKAMADGVVAGTGDTDLQCPGVSFGRFILIKYDDGLASTFGHLSLIKVSVGEQVTRGEIVGYSGSTGYVTGPHLHVSLYARNAVEVKTLPSSSCPGKVLTQPISPVNAYLDPLYYLPPLPKA